MVEHAKFVSRAPLYAVAALAATVALAVAGPAVTAWADDTPAGAQVAAPPPPGEPLVTDQIVIDGAEMTSGQIPIKPAWREPACGTTDPASCAETPVQADSPQTADSAMTGYDCAVARPVAPDFNPDLNGPPDLFCMPTHDASSPSS